jgi:autotransporter translocation and assembly factor TamB
MAMSIRKLMAVSVLALGAMQTAWAADVTGTWAMTVESPMGTGNPTLTLVQKGEEVTGTYKGQLGEAKLAGTLKGNDLNVSYDIDAQGMQLKITYKGTVDGNAMTGKVVYGDQGEGTFKGTKQ